MDYTPLKKKILITGGSSRFCKFLKKELNKSIIYTPSKKIFDICDFDQLKNYIKEKKINTIIHIAGLSRPMNIHEKNPIKSINLNIIGTCNIVKLSILYNIKIIYFSTSFVYPGKKGNYKESDHVKPFTNYGWSKLGGECAVQMVKDSLILRMCITDYPFKHEKAITGAKASFIFNKDAAKIIPFILDENGILNIGGKSRDISKFAKLHKKNITSIHFSKIKSYMHAKNSSLNIEKMKKILKNNKFNFNKIKL